MATGYLNRKTPGIYITELAAFGNSIVGVDTAVPCFIGYTETAKDTSGKPTYMQAVEINSLADYYNAFGYGFHTLYYVAEAPGTGTSGSTPTKSTYDFQASYTEDLGASSNLSVVLNNYVVTQGATADSSGVTFQESALPQFNLFNAIRLFYANGGGKCYIISVNNYWGTQEVVPGSTEQPVTVNYDDLNSGLDVAYNVSGPTMLVIPDACLLTATETTTTSTGTITTGAGSPYAKIVSRMISDSATLQDRVAILDLPGALEPSTWTTAGLTQAQVTFEQAISDVASADADSFGTAYAPALEVSVLTSSDVDFTNLYGGTSNASGGYDGIILMNNLLTTQANSQYAVGSPSLTQVLTQVDTAFPSDGVPLTLSADQISSTNKYLMNALPLFSNVMNILLGKLNVAPPSGIMAGIWTLNDQTRGVWNAPANYGVASVVAPKVVLTDAQQADYNVPLSGNSISILRYFPSRGTVVWGARTLDGNSQDYRYIQVRRTLIYVEQSIKQAIQPFVFAPNVGQTWVTVTSMISNFLTSLWQQGGLMGDKASDAFTVQCGLGSTMTSQDVLNGYMIVAVKLQMVHPAEYIELTFTQMMQGS
ncbi:phage tail sheath family protein [Nitrospirillum iridis]|uniref:Tail sheath protein C-terminal domain-containing protein n=1 Tax=Nitrospirillum iridis TaxID=765888 RepID=A0A7X0EDU3_9PROT|nr:phage tail sheath family protein [Nitrospirillum iridis]MBB6250769.1 hypothetical protein [Nitrospirillum iridis]